MPGKTRKLNLYVVLCFVAGTVFLSSCILDERGPLQGEYGAATPLALETPSNLPSIVIPVSNPLTVEGVELGRKLFYEELLSGNNTKSCGSCHSQPSAFSDNGHQFSLGSSGEVGNRNTIALMNLAWASDYFWDGGAPTLEKQVSNEIERPSSMNTSWASVIQELQANDEYPKLFKKAFGSRYITSDAVCKAIAQFERTLISGNSDFDRFRRSQSNSFSQAAARGFQIFSTDRGGCFHCHSLDLLSDYGYHNNGLDSVFDPSNYGRGMVTGQSTDIGRFKTPNLRNVEVSGPYMHDGRFAGLEEVVEHYNSGIRSSATLDPLIQRPDGLFLTSQEKADLTAFLRSMTDPSFLSEPAYSDPQ